MQTFTNNLKTVLLLGGLTGLLVAIGGALGQNYILPFLLIGVLMNLGVWFFSDKIAIASMRGQPVAESADLYRLVDQLRRQANLPMPRVYLCPHEAPNAFATGRSPKHAAVAVTQGAMQLLSRDELAGVIGHELAHVKNRDTLTAAVAATIAGALASLAHMALFFGGGNRRDGGNPIVALLTIILAPIAAALIQAAISRSREFVADAQGASIAGSPRGLISALQKLDAYGKRIPLHTPSPAMNNMFIIEPLAAMGRGLGGMFATHPPTERRIQALSRLM
jgi:heat shock protein HtpX